MHLFALQVLLGVVGWYSILWGGATRLLKWVSSLKSLETLLVREKPYFSLWCDCRTPRANDAFLSPPCAGRSWGLWITSLPQLVAVLPCVLVLCASLLGCFPAVLTVAYIGVHSVVLQSDLPVPSRAHAKSQAPSQTHRKRFIWDAVRA